MKKKNLKNLALNKKSISNLGKNELTGGTLVVMTASCEPGICQYVTEYCPTKNCETKDCETNVGCNQTNFCIRTVDNCPQSLSCYPIGVC